jgi:hypothetical protein
MISGSTGSTGTTGTTGTTGSTGTTGTTGSTGTTFRPYSAVGTLTLDGAGNFAITEYVVSSSAAAQTVNQSGTYSVNNNCALSLTFATPTSGTSSAVPTPAAFTTLLGISPTGAYNGLITVQPTSGSILSGTIIGQ